MKKRMIFFLLATVMLPSLILSVAAAEPRDAHYAPNLSFDGTTANCSVSITALGKPITATLELWQGSTCIASWSDSATSYLIISEECSVTNGQTYTLKVSGTIDGEPLSGIPTTAICP